MLINFRREFHIRPHFPNNTKQKLIPTIKTENLTMLLIKDFIFSQHCNSVLILPKLRGNIEHDDDEREISYGSGLSNLFE